MSDMATFHQKLDNVKDSLASLFKSRRRRQSLNICVSGDDCYDGDGSISMPQNVKRVVHITFDAGRKSFDGIPEHWRQYFEERVSGQLTGQEDAIRADDSGVSLATSGTLPPQEPAVAPPKELLSLTYDRDNGRFVDLPPHWRDRLERNNLLAPEFQRNPDLLVAVFALMDEELRAMSKEGLEIDEGMFCSSPAAAGDDAVNQLSDCPYVYEIEADRSNTSSEQNFGQDTTNGDAANGSFDPNNDDAVAGLSGSQRQERQPSLVRLRAVSVPQDFAE